MSHGPCFWLMIILHILWEFLIVHLSSNRSFLVFSLFVLNLSQSVNFCWLGFAAPIFVSITFYLQRKPEMIIPCFWYLIMCFVWLLSFCSFEGRFFQQLYVCHFYLNLILLIGFVWCIFFAVKLFQNLIFLLLLDLLMVLGFPCRT